MLRTVGNGLLCRSHFFGPPIKLYRNFSLSTKKFNNHKKSVDVSFEHNQVLKFLPEIMKEVLDEQLYFQKNDSELRERYSKLLDYTVRDIIYLSRPILTLYAYRQFEKPSLLTEDNIKKACILGWCLKMIDASIIIDDDIADSASLRYNKPTWFTLEDVGVNKAILDAAFLESAFNFLMINHFIDHPQYYNIHKELLRSYACTNIGQMIETRKHKVEDLEKYENFAKVDHLGYQPIVASALYLANIDDEEAHAASKSICLEISRFLKADDDVKGVMTSTLDSGKHCTDISEGRTSWLVIQAFKRGNDAQRKCLLENFGRDDEDSVEKVCGLFNDLQLFEVFEKYRTEFYEKMYLRIQNDMPKILPTQLYIDLLNFSMTDLCRI